MSHIAQFTIIGRVGAIKEVGSTLRVTVASSYSFKDDHGDWIDRANWNEITIFNDNTKGYVRRNISVGDLISTQGTISQTSYEKDGERVYTTRLACERIDRLVKMDREEEPASQTAPAKQRELVDDSIPF
jgi:single-stranded DNA-binding protein